MNIEKFLTLDPGGCVYLIQNTNTQNIKIGCTRNIPEERRKELQTGSDAPLQVIHSIKCNNIACEYFEKRLHSFFKINHVLGEWYQLSPEAIDWLQSVQTSQDLY